MSVDHNRAKYLSQLKKVNGLEISAIPLYQTIPKGVKTEIPVLFRLMVGDYSEVVHRKALHICLVLDRSGSMSGAPLESSKKAVKHVITQLESTDKVSFLVYDDATDVVFTQKSVLDYDELVPLIDQVSDRGFTNISGALEKAAEILNLGNQEYQKIVFLFSDGEANRGITQIDDLGLNLTQWVETDKIRFSSFGIGTKYNEKWMRSIARGGEGNYFFIDNVDNIPSLVEKGLDGFTTLIGNHVNFKVRSLNGHLLTSLQNDKSLETLINGRTLPYIRSLGLYQFIATIELCGQTDLFTASQEVLEYQLTFKPCEGLENLVADQLKGRLSLNFAEIDTNEFEKNGDVVCYLTIGQCAELNHQVDTAMKENRKKDAIELKKQIIDKYESVLHLDQFGVIGAMLQREKKTLGVIEKEGLTQRAEKAQEYTSSYGYCCTTSINKAVWEDKKKEAVDEDADMGYELFDADDDVDY